MSRVVYRYQFVEGVSFDEALATLELSLIAVESMYGDSRSRLDARFVDDAKRRLIVIDGSTALGRALNEIFVGYARREFGERAFRVERVDRLPVAAEPAGAPG